MFDLKSEREVVVMACAELGKCLGEIVGNTVEEINNSFHNYTSVINTFRELLFTMRIVLPVFLKVNSKNAPKITFGGLHK